VDSEQDVTQKELARQFRVLDQMISMHNVLAQRFLRLSLILDISLLTFSVIFCATTFASDDFFLFLGLTPRSVKLVLGITSVMAFLAAVLSLRVDWKRSEARHREAVQKLTACIAQFRETRLASGEWPDGKAIQLSRLYRDTANGIIPIADRLFPSLKAKHLRKVALSKLIDTHYGIPVFVLRIVIALRGPHKER